MPKKKRFLEGISIIDNEGMPDFEGKIIYKGPFEFGDETTFCISTHKDPEGNPAEIKFDLNINCPGEDENFKILIELEEVLDPEKHLTKEPWVPVLEASNNEGLPRGRGEILAFMFNTAKDAKLKITTSDSEDDVFFLLTFERFETEASVDIGDIPQIEKFLNRRHEQMRQEIGAFV